MWRYVSHLETIELCVGDEFVYFEEDEATTSQPSLIIQLLFLYF